MRWWDQGHADDGSAPLGLPLSPCVAPHEHGDPHHPDDDRWERLQHCGKDEPAMLLPVLNKGHRRARDKEREGHQEEDVDQRTTKSTRRADRVSCAQTCHPWS